MTTKPTPKPTQLKMKMRCTPFVYRDQRIFLVPRVGSEPFFSILFSLVDNVL